MLDFYQTSATTILGPRIVVTSTILSMFMLLSGCDTPATHTNESAASTENGKIDAPGPKADPTRDEASELIHVCGSPTSDVSKVIQGNGTQRVLSYRKYGVDFFFHHNETDSPKWTSTAVFVGEDNIDRKTLSRKMPCSKKMKLYTVDAYDQWMLSH